MAGKFWTSEFLFFPLSFPPPLPQLKEKAEPVLLYLREDMWHWFFVKSKTNGEKRNLQEVVELPLKLTRKVLQTGKKRSQGMPPEMETCSPLTKNVAGPQRERLVGTGCGVQSWYKRTKKRAEAPISCANCGNNGHPTFFKFPTRTHG